MKFYVRYAAGEYFRVSIACTIPLKKGHGKSRLMNDLKCEKIRVLQNSNKKVRVLYQKVRVLSFVATLSFYDRILTPRGQEIIKKG